MQRFYTCPVIAAYMTKHYGMEFTDGGEFRLDPFAYDAHDARQRFFIHADSLHLLEPQDGDLSKHGLAYDAAHQYWCCCSTTMLRHSEFAYGPEWIICQRDGKPFFWPESAP